MVEVELDVTDIGSIKAAVARAETEVGPIDVQDDVFVGHQAVVMPGVRIGSGSVAARARQKSMPVTMPCTW